MSQSNSKSSGSPFHPAIWRRTSARDGASIGAKESPSWPTTSSVTPWLTLAVWSGLTSSCRSEWACMSMKPGESTRPAASTVRSAEGVAESVWMPVTRPSATVTCAGYAGAPVPSITSASRISSSVMVTPRYRSEPGADEVDDHGVIGIGVVDDRDEGPLVEGGAGVGEPESQLVTDHDRRFAGPGRSGGSRAGR